MKSNIYYSDEDNDDFEEDDNPLPMWLDGDTLAPPCNAPISIVSQILEILNPNENDILYDLGCGDGRICLEAGILYGCESKGIEIEENLYNKFQQKINENNLNNKIEAINDDLRNINFNNATIIVIYLLPEAIEEIKEKLIECLNNGCQILCNTWGIKNIEPKEIYEIGEYNNVRLLYYNKN